MAADTQQQAHRPGALKQQNKSHKHGKHKSKGILDRETKGRVNVKVLSKKSKLVQRKNDRRYQALQQRKQKREEVLAKKRNRGSHGTPPHLVVVLALHKSVNCQSCLDLLQACDDTNTVKQSETGIHHVSVPRFKQRTSFFIAEYGNLYAVLDAAKIADSVLCVMPPDGIDEFGEKCLTCLKGQGIPALTFSVQGLKSVAPKKQGEVKKYIQRLIDKSFPSEKFHSLDTNQDGLLVLRQLTSHKLRPVYYREYRPHLIAENITFDQTDPQSGSGTLKVTGYIRGRTLSVNGLVHLPGWGEFQMLQIDAPDDPYPLTTRTDKQQRKNSVSQDVEMENISGPEVKVLDRVNPSQQESLQSEVELDPMEGEQTWPTEEELREAEAQAKKKVVKRVPKGTSEYQAAWIVDSDEEDLGDEEDDLDEEDNEEMEAEDDDDDDSDEDKDADDEEYETLTVTDGDEDAKYDETIDVDEDMKIFEKIKEEKQHVMFPDEIDTPMDKNARTRFARYRGLKSFRTSPWDPKENLPIDYARIFQFQNFKKTKKRVLSELEDLQGAMPGWYVTVHVANVPKAFMDAQKPGIPVVIFGLLPHEQKMSVVHFVIKKCADVSRPVKSKERLIFHIGFRRFSACPVFSQHTNGDKHKFERFLGNGATVATLYAPITFPPAPVLVFQQQPFGEQKLVATGTLLNVNPDRIISKRAVLSGYPFKINKRSAVIRYMFFNRDDIAWFKPVELRTKWGRRGHIKEPLGTHGHMKCIFDGQLKSQDTVLMNLYKRVFPKWTYNPIVISPVIHQEASETMETEREQAYTLFD